MPQNSKQAASQERNLGYTAVSGYNAHRRNTELPVAMGTKLFIVESPNKVKKIKQILGEGWLVKSSVGHIRDLPRKAIGVEPPEFKPVYEILEHKKKVVAELRKIAVNTATVYLGMDPDREGEAIAWHLYVALGLKKSGRHVYRPRFHEINKRAIVEAINKAGPIDYQLVAAQETRRVLDRLVGYRVSPRLGYGLSAGRVQSPALRLVVDREREIRNFNTVAYYEVEAHMDRPLPWKAVWESAPYRAKEQKHWLDRAVAETVAKVTRVRVVSADKTKKEKRPPAPFTTSTLQQAASVQLKLSPERTMELAQSLFAQGAITYHRTDNANLSEEAIGAIVAHIKAQGWEPASKPNKWPSKENAQEAHEAIRPVDVNALEAGENDGERALYGLIWRRAVASQMANAVFDATDILLEGNVGVLLGQKDLARFKASGEVPIAQRGWMALYGEDAGRGADQVPRLPEVTNGEVFGCLGKLLGKQTKPPPRYTEASLVKKLEDLGIGRPSTYAAILKNIKDREYIIINKSRSIEPTEKGEAIIDALVGAGFSFLIYNYTRSMESKLDDVAAGKAKYLEVVTAGHAVLEQELPRLPEHALAQYTQPSAVAILRKSGAGKGGNNGASCACGGSIVKSAKAWSCSKCRAIVWSEIGGKKISERTALALLGGKTVKLKGLKSNTGKKFDADAAMRDGKVAFIFGRNRQALSRNDGQTESSSRRQIPGPYRPKISRPGG